MNSLFDMLLSVARIQYTAAVRKMVESGSEGEPKALDEAIQSLKLEAEHGNAHAQSTLAFLYGSGYGMEQSDSKAFLYHHFASNGGNPQSKMALAYSYSRQQVWRSTAQNMFMSLAC